MFLIFGTKVPGIINRMPIDFGDDRKIVDAVDIFLCSLCSPEFFTDVFEFWYVGFWHHKEDAYNNIF